MSVIQDNSITTNSVEPASGQSLVLKKAGGTASITVATTGEATFAENIILTANKGINFSAYGSEDSSSATTVSNNLLDDYEEGTWTPVFADASSGGDTSSTTASTADYTKIGNQVTLFVSMNNINTTGLSGGVHFQGLPFVSTNCGVGIPRVQHINYASGDKLLVAIVRSDYIEFDFIISGNFDTPLTVADCVSGSVDFEFTLTYKTS